MNAEPESYATVYPNENQMSAPMHASRRFLRRMFFVFFARTVPASRRAKPHCMKKTRKPQMSSQNVSACVAPKEALCDAARVSITNAALILY